MITARYLREPIWLQLKKSIFCKHAAGMPPLRLDGLDLG